MDCCIFIGIPIRLTSVLEVRDMPYIGCLIFGFCSCGGSFSV